MESFSWTDSGLISDAAGDLVAQKHRYSIYLEDGTTPVFSGLKVDLSKVNSLDPDHPTLAQFADVFGTDEASILSKLNVGANTLKVRLDGDPQSKVLATVSVTVKEDAPVTPDPDPGTPTDPGENPTDPETPTDPGDTPTDPGDTPTDPGQTPTDPNTPTDPGQNPPTPDDHPANGGEQPTDPNGGSQTPGAQQTDDGTYQPPVTQPGVDEQDTAGQAKLAQTGGDDSGLWTGVGAASLLIAGGSLTQVARRKRG
ncbi:LPXTG cell wall anchor domain-containing protein [Pseudoclavibacter sp. CFCC 14310]|uniref:LPXTG cell wall anchor domain-containing protein n=1 Tax=Pseudoclavibacter sp. CFCC 14310 TaxID=2615180 RepID=UPI0013013476|nr:LPXTG cell wall anchor domain-containing protein [Pseudoclavibacter sp. CFCC 14310]KAB1646200.1 LPXTG cell wall anchor domain-containing protein [Pseudoclavibacter sp. CFCC 14310]